MKPQAYLVAFAAVAAVAAEIDGSPGILAGLLVDVPTASTGEVHIRSGDKQYRCGYDEGTYIERFGHGVDAVDLRPSDRVEIIADRKGSMPCYARTIRVAEETDPNRRLRARPAMPEYDGWLQRGDQNLNGVILRLTSDSLTLRTRAGEEKQLLLRPDTRYVDSGVASNLEQLRPNTRVFIRAGENLDKRLEAYQIVWGEIDGPSIRRSQ